MKRAVFLLLCLVLLGAFSRTWGAEKQTNFIVFLTDDQGWGDLGCYGHPEIKSPNLDKFRTEGMKLTQCYAACSVCSPSRSAIQTGRTPYRNGVWRWIPEGSQYHLRESEITIAELLKQKGYDTCHAGKWHLNGHFNQDSQPQPDDHGYDHWLATQNNAAPNHMNPVNYVRNGEPVGRMEGPSSVLAVAEAVTWLKNREDQSKPFFITVWTHEPHLPIESAEKFMEPYQHLDDPDLRQHHGNITQLDHAFGNLMTAIDEMGFRGETFVMFTSDNGPEGNGVKGRTRGSTGGLRGRKRHTHEGGIRVPGLVRWPEHVAAGSESDTPVIGSDIFATILEIAGISLPHDRVIDGASILPIFQGKEITRSEPLYWRNHLAPESTRVALRIGDWKIIGSDDLTQFELYHIQSDWQETADLKEEMPEKFEEMKAKLIEQDREVLGEGPDWWKDDKQKPRSKRTVELAPGKDEVGDFDVVKGGTVRPTDFGVELVTKNEALALRELEKPVTRLTVSLKYRSTNRSNITRNAFFCFGDVPTNAETVKVGTAIGMGNHAIFRGGWGNLGSLAKTSAKFEPLQIFEMTVTADTEKHVVTAVIDGQEITSPLPKSMKWIQYSGIYVKDTGSEFAFETEDVSR